MVLSPPHLKQFRSLFVAAKSVVLAVALALYFVSSLIIGALLHIDLPITRAAIARLTETSLDGVIRGTVRIGKISHLAESGVDLEQVEIFDPSERAVIRVRHLSADVNPMKILERVLANHSKLSIEISRVRIEGVEVNLLRTDDVDEAGKQLTHLSLSDTFEAIEQAEISSTPSREVRVWFPKIDLLEVYARGAVEGSDTFEARVHQARASTLATNNGAAIDIKRFGITSSGLLNTDTVAEGEVHIRAPGAVWGSINGTIGQVPLTQHFRFESSKVLIEGELPEVAPHAMTALLGTWPLDRTLSLKNRISGRLPYLALHVTAQGPHLDGTWPGKIALSGTVNLGKERSAKLELDTHSINLKSLNTELPESEIDSSTQATLRLEQGALIGTVQSTIQPGRIEDYATPNIDLSGEIQKDQLVADAQVHERGWKANIHIENDKDEVIRFNAELPPFTIEETPRLSALIPAVRGSVEAGVRGTYEKGQLNSSMNIRTRELRMGEFSVADATIIATNKTDLGKPLTSTAGLNLNAQGVGFGIFKFDTLQAKAEGPILRPQVKITAGANDGLKLTASSQVDLEGPALSKLNAELTGRGQPVSVMAKQVAFTNSRVVVTDFLIRSIGEVQGNVDLGADGGKVRLSAKGLDLARIGETLGYARNEVSGELDAEIDLEIAEGAEGTLNLEVRNGAVFGVTGVEFDATSSFQGRHVQGKLSAAVNKLGTLSGDWNGEIAGSLMKAKSFSDAVGALHLRVSDLDLKTLSVLVSGLEVPRAEGYLDVEIDVQRQDKGDLPTLAMSASTRNVILETEGEHYAGVDLRLAMTMPQGAEVLETALHFSDGQGSLASVSGEMQLPFAAWSRNLPDRGEFLRTIQDAPLSLVVLIPEREIASWPRFIPQPVQDGSLSARVVLGGTVGSPEIELRLEASDLLGGFSHFSEPLNLKWNTRYLAKNGSLRGSLAAERTTQRLGSLHYDLNLPSAHLLSHPGEEVPFWTGSAQLLLESSPLDIIEDLKSSRLRGRAQGSIELSRTGLLPEMSGELHLRKIGIDDHELGDAQVDLQTHGGDLIARADFSDEYGSLKVSAEVGIVGTSLLLAPASDRPLRFNLQSEQYNAAVLSPLVADLFDEFSGTLNGQVRIELEPPPAQSSSDAWDASFSGKLQLRDGTFTPSALGQRLSDAEFNLSARREGAYNIVQLDHFAAKADSKMHNLKGQGHVVFEAFKLRGGEFVITPTKVPFLLDGAKMADLTGEALGRFEMKDDALNLAVTLDDLTADIAQASKSDLLPLDENPSIQVIQEERKDETTDTREGLALNIVFNLGENVRIKGAGVDMRVTGTPEMRVAEKVEMRGDVKFLQGGRFQILGRGFTLEPGSLTFDTDEMANPHVNVSATWTAPDGVIVRMTVRGTVREPVLEWTSEPALPGGEAEIIGLVLGGGSNADQGSARSASLAIAANEALGATAASGVVQVYMTQQDGSGEGRVAGMTESNWSNYTAAIRLSEDLWFEGSLQRGSTGFQAMERQGVSGTLDWRFLPQWSARTELGTLGAGIDLLWRYRY